MVLKTVSFGFIFSQKRSLEITYCCFRFTFIGFRFMIKVNVEFLKPIYSISYDRRKLLMNGKTFKPVHVQLVL